MDNYCRSVTLLSLKKPREFLSFVQMIAIMFFGRCIALHSYRLGRKTGIGWFLIAALAQSLHLSAASVDEGEMSPHVDWPVEFRGYALYGGEPRFSLRDLETGHAWWMKTGEERLGFRIEGFNAHEKTLLVSREGTSREIPLKEPEDHILMVRSSISSLSPINRKVYLLSERLIRASRSEATGRLVRDDRHVQKLREYLLTNPSVQDLHAFLPELGDAIDYDEFLKIDFPDVVNGRNKQNTPRWGIDRSLDLRDIEQLVATNPTKAELDSALQEK